MNTNLEVARMYLRTAQQAPYDQALNAILDSNLAIGIMLLDLLERLNEE